MESSILNMIRNNVDNPRNYLPGEMVFTEGSPGTTMYVVIDGNIEIRVGGKSIEVAGPGGDRWRDGAD